MIALERQDDAERVMDALNKRMEKYGLTLHPEKTRLFAFSPPSGDDDGKGSATFDLLGFTLYWRRTRRGSWAMWCKTRHARVSRAIKAAADWCRRHRHLSVKDQHAALKRRIQRHINYFGVNGNIESLDRVVRGVRRAWRKWLNRRSQRARVSWERFLEIEERFPLPRPHVVVDIWDADRESHRQRSRMVEISSSGSGEGRGTNRGYSTKTARRSTRRRTAPTWPQRS